MVYEAEGERLKFLQGVVTQKGYNKLLKPSFVTAFSNYRSFEDELTTNTHFNTEKERLVYDIPLSRS